MLGPISRGGSSLPHQIADKERIIYSIVIINGNLNY